MENKENMEKTQEQHSALAGHYPQKKSVEKCMSLLLLILVLVVFYNLLTLSTSSYVLKKQSGAYKEFMKPLSISLTTITPDDCSSCSSLAPWVNALKQLNVNITETSLSASSPQGKALLAQYNLKKAPTLILSGNFSTKPGMDAALAKFLTKKSSDVYVLENVVPPYVDLATSKVRGEVVLTLITASDCKDCVNIDPLAQQLGKLLSIKKIDKVAYDTVEGKELINKYSLQHVPAVLISKEAAVYPQFDQAWSKYGVVDKDGTYIFTQISPPYLDVQSKNILGYVDVTYLTDKSCGDCYDVNLHKQILTQMGIKLQQEKVFDIADAAGKALVEQYKITKVPTVILTGDIGLYPGLAQVWQQVGTVEKDGAYVFRTLEQLQQDLKFKDLTQKDVPKNATAAA